MIYRAGKQLISGAPPSLPTGWLDTAREEFFEGDHMKIAHAAGLCGYDDALRAGWIRFADDSFEAHKRAYLTSLQDFLCRLGLEDDVLLFYLIKLDKKHDGICSVRQVLESRSWLDLVLKTEREDEL